MYDVLKRNSFIRNVFICGLDLLIVTFLMFVLRSVANFFGILDLFAGILFLSFMFFGIYFLNSKLLYLLEKIFKFKE